MQKRWFTLLSCMALAAMLTLLVGQRPASGQDDRDERGAKKLAGTWNVTLKFEDCSPTCPCPGGVPNISIPALQTYLKGESMLDVPGGTLFRGPGTGSWRRLGGDDFVAHFKFFLFKSDGTGARAGSEVVTSHIDLTGPDAFEAAASFDLFDPVGNLTGQRCRINETATRFE